MLDGRKFATHFVLMVVSILMGCLLSACGGGSSSSNSSSSSPTAPSALSYASPQTYTAGAAITALIPAVTGTVSSYSVSPALPAGLVLDPTSGQISGTPMVVTATATYLITASNSAGSTTFLLTLTIKLPQPVVAVSYGMKQVVLAWSPISGATHYQIYKNASCFTGYSKVGGDLSVTTYSDGVAVHLTDWINASYIVAACDGAVCTDSAVVYAMDSKQAIGYFKASNTGPNDMFGGAVVLSADGNTLAVGAVGEASNASGIDGSQTDNSLSLAGAVYVFVRDGGVWAQQAYVKASNTDSGDQFGAALALNADGTILAVGAAGEMSSTTGINGVQGDNSAFNSGAVYVFARSGSTWSQQAYVKASNTDVGDLFGKALALNGDGTTLAVGAPEESSSAFGINGTQSDNSRWDSGAVYVFIRSGTAWSQQAYVKALNTDYYDYFGQALALSGDGDTLAVAAPGEGSNATGVDGNQSDNSMFTSGAAYVFVRTAGAWSQQTYVKASNTETYDAFGAAIALSADGSTLAVGATGEDSSASGINGTQTDNAASISGAVYLFGRTNSAWSQQAYVKASNTDADDIFGDALALSGDGSVLAVGAREASNAVGIGGSQSDNSEIYAGAAYVFSRVNGDWIQNAYVKASNTRSSAFFASAVALTADGQTLAVGATGETNGGSGIGAPQTTYFSGNAGAVYLY